MLGHLPPGAPEPASSVFLTPELLAWLLAQSAALVVAMLWVASLLAAVKRKDRELQTSHERNALLSDWLCRSVESACAERSRLNDAHIFRIDSIVRSHNDLLMRALDSALTTPDSCSKPSEPEM